MNEKITITFANGGQTQADLICFIENTANNKKYAYYTLNETVGVGASSTVKIYVANLKLNNPALDTPISEEEWGVLKGFMGDALKGNSNPNVKYIPLVEVGGNIEVVGERAIAMPTSYDYINKQRGIYATAVADSETSSSEPAADTSSATITPVAPSIEPTPVSTPEVSTPLTSTVEPVLTPTSPEPVNVAPAQEPIQEPTITPETPVIQESVVTPEDNDSTTATGSALQLEPIDIVAIEAKYAEMIADIEKLKNREIEAAKRYNATIELSQMHNEQHASYVQSEAQKEVPITPTSTPEVMSAPTPNPVPVAGTPFIESPAPVVEPTPIATTVPEPAPTMGQTDIETNWFDMPAA